MSGLSLVDPDEEFAAERAMAQRLRRRRRHPALAILAVSLAATTSLTVAWAVMSSAAEPLAASRTLASAAMTEGRPASEGHEPRNDIPRPALSSTLAVLPAEPPVAAPETVVAAHSAPAAVPAEAPLAAAKPAVGPVASAVPAPVLPASVPVAPVPASDPPSRAQVAAYMGRARDLTRSGNIAAARGLLERAAEGDDSDALFALAETYDPAVLARWGARGIRADAAMARRLYGRASEKGMRVAGERLLAMRQ